MFGFTDLRDALAFRSEGEELGDMSGKLSTVVFCEARSSSEPL